MNAASLGKYHQRPLAGCNTPRVWYLPYVVYMRSRMIHICMYHIYHTVIIYCVYMLDILYIVCIVCTVCIVYILYVLYVLYIYCMYCMYCIYIVCTVCIVLSIYNTHSNCVYCTYCVHYVTYTYVHWSLYCSPHILLGRGIGCQEDASWNDHHWQVLLQRVAARQGKMAEKWEILV